MSKYFSRFGAEKVNYMITAHLISFQANVKAKTYFQIQWIRGPQVEQTEILNIANVGNDNAFILINKSFTRQSQLYRDGKNGKFKSKIVILILIYISIVLIQTA